MPVEKMSNAQQISGYYAYRISDDWLRILFCLPFDLDGGKSEFVFRMSLTKGLLWQDKTCSEINRNQETKKIKTPKRKSINGGIQTKATKYGPTGTSNNETDSSERN